MYFQLNAEVLQGKKMQFYQHSIHSKDLLLVHETATGQ